MRLQFQLQKVNQELLDTRKKMKEMNTREAWVEMGAENVRVKMENASLKKTLSIFNGGAAAPKQAHMEPITGSARNPYMASARLLFGYDAAAAPMTLPEWAQPTDAPMGTADRFSNNVSMDFTMAGQQSASVEELLSQDDSEDEASFDELLWR